MNGEHLVWTPRVLWRELIPEYRNKVKDAVVSVRNSSPIPGLGVAGGFKLMVEDRGGRGLADLQSQTDGLTRKLQEDARLADVPTGFARSTTALPGHRPDKGRSPWECRLKT